MFIVCYFILAEKILNNRDSKKDGIEDSINKSKKC